jgi:hypothetical protein
VQYCGFRHAVVKKAVPQGTRRGGGVVKPGTDEKIDQSGDNAQTDDDIVENAVLAETAENDKHDDHVAHIEGKPGNEGNVVKPDEFPHCKKQEQRRVGEDHRLPLFFRPEPVSKDKSAIDKAYGQHVRQKTETIKGVVKKKTHPLNDQYQGKGAVKDKVFYGGPARHIPAPYFFKGKEKICRPGSGTEGKQNPRKHRVHKENIIQKAVAEKCQFQYTKPE